MAWGPPIAANARGIVRKGPTPIIFSTLADVAPQNPALRVNSAWCVTGFTSISTTFSQRFPHRFISIGGLEVQLEYRAGAVALTLSHLFSRHEILSRYLESRNIILTTLRFEPGTADGWPTATGPAGRQN